MTPTASQMAGLLAAICEKPEDVGLRLIYADACEEAGDADRAEFVRIQCEQAALGESDDDSYRIALRRRGREIAGRHHSTASGANCYSWCPPLLKSYRFIEWKPMFRRGFVEEVILPTAAWHEYGPRLVRAAPLTRVVLSDRTPRLYLYASEKPLWRWLNGTWAGEHALLVDTDCLPEWLWEAYTEATAYWESGREHESEQEALDALSLAALSWARSQPCP